MTAFATLLTFALHAATLPAAPSCPAAFAGSGDATFYDTGFVGACILSPAPNEHVAAINGAQWEGSAHCGECLRVTGPRGTTVVRIVDKCPECPAGDIDLSPDAFDAIANRIDGRVSASWERVACPVSGEVAVQFAQGSSPFFVDFQVQNHRYGVASVAFVTPGGQTPIPRVDDNHFTFASGIAPPVTLRITATTGQVLEQTFDSVDGSSSPRSVGAQFATCTDSFYRDGFE